MLLGAFKQIAAFGSTSEADPVTDPQSLTVDPFCGGCGAAAGYPCDAGCGGAMDGTGAGAVLLFAAHVPGASNDVDPEIVAHEFVTMVNEVRHRSGGGLSDVAVSVAPTPRWMTGVSEVLDSTSEADRVAGYLDHAIRRWRKSSEPFAVYYVDAFQSARVSLVGELLPLDEEQCEGCEGSGVVYENHGQGQVEALGCPDCEGTGKVPVR